MGAKPPPSPPFACLTGLDFILFFIVACGIGVSLVAPAFHRLSVKYQNVSVFSALPLGLGIIVALLVYGVLQERIVTRPYYDSDGNEKYFKFSIFMVICNRTAAACYSFIMIKLSGESIRGQVPPYKYAAVSFANVVATTLVAVVMTLTLRRCQYEALKYVNFAMQTLGKSAKMLPVMLWGKFINHKTYKSQDYIIVTLVTIGITIFGCGGDISSSASDGKGYGSQIIGIALIAGYCMFDSFSSTFQEKLFKGVTTTHYNQMFWVNVWSSILSIFGMLMYGTDAFWKAISFVQQHPSIMGDVLTLSVAQVTAQNFIFRTVKEFGALMLAGFMNTRQFLSVIISTVKFGHAVSLLQWVGVALIFGALYGKVYLGQQAKKSSAETELIAPKAQDAVSPEETKGLIQERAPEDSEPKV